MRQQLRPLFDRVVIKELDPDRVRRSGLIVPPGSEEPPPQHGIVLAVGPGLDWWDHVGIAMPVRPGDHVVFPASAGVWIEVEEERLLVCRVGELLGVLESVENCPGCGGRPAGRRRVLPGLRARGLDRLGPRTRPPARRTAQDAAAAPLRLRRGAFGQRPRLRRLHPLEQV